MHGVPCPGDTPRQRKSPACAGLGLAGVGAVPIRQRLYFFIQPPWPPDKACFHPKWRQPRYRGLRFAILHLELSVVLSESGGGAQYRNFVRILQQVAHVIAKRLLADSSKQIPALTGSDL